MRFKEFNNTETSDVKKTDGLTDSLQKPTTNKALKENTEAHVDIKVAEPPAEAEPKRDVKGKTKKTNPRHEHVERLSGTKKVEDPARRLSPKETEKIKSITSAHFDRAREITRMAKKTTERGVEKDDKGANFTDHNEKHVEQVKIKTTKALQAFEDAIKAKKMESANSTGDVHFSGNVDYKVTQAAALAHDTGMSDDGYAFKCDGKTPIKENGEFVIEKQDPSVFDLVRNNHSANSMLNVLANREQYREAGFSDSQIDEIAVLTYSHTKSNSGIGNLNDSASWKEGFDRIDALVSKYNEDHPDKPISFDRAQFENDSDRLGALATESLALRVGDVSRDSGPDAPSQSGDVVHVERNDAEIPEGYDLKAETDCYDITVGENTLKINDGMSQKEIDDIVKAKQVHIGEQNIVGNDTEFKGSKIVHTITVNDGNHAPICTAEAIKDHLGEFASAKNGEFVVNIEFNTPCDKKMQEKYDVWRDKIYEDGGKQSQYSNIAIIFPWDKED